MSKNGISIFKATTLIALGFIELISNHHWQMTDQNVACLPMGRH
jgi:hypothetical protein